jgi:apolipoprotein N-acyltransferase
MFSVSRVFAVRLLLAAGGGLLLSAAFPKVGLAGAAWVGPGLILFSALGCGGGRAFRLGFVGGLAHFLTSLYWLVAIPYTFHGVPVGPACGWFLLSAYCALFPALWVWLCWRIWAPPPAADLPAGEAVDRFFAAGVLRRGLWAFNTALIWVALEMARGRLFSGFPWNFLGASQFKMLPLIQMASVTGIYGVSFIVAWMSVALVMTLGSMTRRPGRGVWGEAGAPLLTAAVLASLGVNRVANSPPAGAELTVALVQPAFLQTVIWDQDQDEARLNQMIALSDKALAAPASLLLWPEGALSGLTAEHLDALAKLTSRHGAWLAATADLSEISARGGLEYFNGSILLNPKGEVEAVYHKRRLVIFGEYLPSWLWFLKWVTPIDGSFTPGREPAQFVMKNPGARFSVLICFEDVFAEEAREHATPETDFLVNLTNDGWFGKGAAQWQQAAAAVFRAVENGLPLVRCTNDGLTCWIDAQGRLKEIFSAAGRDDAAGFMRAQIPLRTGGERTRTFYNLHGDWFGWSCCGVSLCLCAATVRRRTGDKA